MPSVADLFVTIKLKTGKVTTMLTNMAKGVARLANAFQAVDADFRKFDQNITAVKVNVVGLDQAIQSFQGRLVNITISTNISAVMAEFHAFDQTINKVWVDLLSIDHEINRLNNKTLVIKPEVDIKYFLFELAKLSFMMAGFQAFNPFQNMMLRVTSIIIANPARQHINDYLGRQEHALHINKIVISNPARANVNYFLQQQGHVLKISSVDLSGLVVPPIEMTLSLGNAMRQIVFFRGFVVSQLRNIPFTVAPVPSEWINNPLGTVIPIPPGMGMPTQQGGEPRPEGGVATTAPVMPGAAAARPGLISITNNFDFRDATVTDDGIIERIRQAITQQMDSIAESMRNRLSRLGGT